jgi:hypothetical protein
LVTKSTDFGHQIRRICFDGHYLSLSQDGEASFISVFVLWFEGFLLPLQRLKNIIQ